MGSPAKLLAMTPPAVPSLDSLDVLLGPPWCRTSSVARPWGIGYEGDLGVDGLGEKIMIAFREYFDLSLPGCPGQETITIPSDL